MGASQILSVRIGRTTVSVLRRLRLFAPSAGPASAVPDTNSSIKATTHPNFAMVPSPWKSIQLVAKPKAKGKHRSSRDVLSNIHKSPERDCPVLVTTGKLRIERETSASLPRADTRSAAPPLGPLAKA